MVTEWLTLVDHFFFIFGIFITRQPSFRIPKEGIHLVNVACNGRIILKLIVKKYDVIIELPQYTVQSIHGHGN